ncbi:putative dehydrogenase [Branchiibius hedensis]|uniref:Predicted dehydrogenase n=1 Tax=Branchiibius hedensis TaxID=672460 RepID=A0A2Y8ZNT4_9MICO|nr:Gfo/Idh/MocA family oxidoreductase [Branchiibius hedensis]PWJ24209.1 putative dehydrogenase [Branchiibius hedensis]SSA33026.1 Predicted dehydrogenase [Branchiibius hedensis]
MPQLGIAVAGAGLIGRRHIEEIVACDATRLVGVLDPAPTGREVAAAYDVPCVDSWPDLFDRCRPDGVIVATPNAQHVPGGLACIEAGIPVLVEKPLAPTTAEAEVLVAAAETSGVPLLVGHHRQHSPLLRETRAIIDSGALGSIVAVSGSATFAKPADYFDVGGGWRREPGGGPVLINLVHDVNALLGLFGPIVQVEAIAANATRGFPVEDTAAILFRFASGALGTFTLSDAAASPWSWEQTAQENLAYPTFPDEDCYRISGTLGSLGVPTMRLRTTTGEPSWWSPMQTRVLEVHRTDPLAEQIAHFAAVIRGECAPLVTGRSGLETLRVIDAIEQSIARGAEMAVAS